MRRDPIREALQVQIELNARARERDPLPDPITWPPHRLREAKPDGNRITEDDLLRGYRGLRSWPQEGE